MVTKIYILFFLLFIQITLSSDIDTLIYDDETFNNGDNRIITITSVKGLRIFTKIEKSCKIFVEITSEKAINTDLIYYDRAETESDLLSSKDDKPTVTVSGNKYSCWYSVKKTDKFNYGVLIVEDVYLGQQLSINVRVVNNKLFWAIIVVIIILALALLVGLYIFCRKCYRCMSCSK